MCSQDNDPKSISKGKESTEAFGQVELAVDQH